MMGGLAILQQPCIFDSHQHSNCALHPLGQLSHTATEHASLTATNMEHQNHFCFLLCGMVESRMKITLWETFWRLTGSFPHDKPIPVLVPGPGGFGGVLVTPGQRFARYESPHARRDDGSLGPPGQHQLSFPPLNVLCCTAMITEQFQGACNSQHWHPKKKD